MRENTDQKNSEYRHISRSANYRKFRKIWPKTFRKEYFTVDVFYSWVNKSIYQYLDRLHMYVNKAFD